MRTYRIKVRDKSFLVRAKDENEAFTKVRRNLIKDGNYVINYENMNTDEQGTAKITAGDIKQAFVEFEKYIRKNGMGVDSIYVVSVSPNEGKDLRGSLRAINARIRYRVVDAKIKDGHRQVYPDHIAKYAWSIERNLVEDCYWEAVDELEGKLRTEQDYVREIPKLAKQKFENYIKQVRVEFEKLISAGRAQTSEYSKWAPEQARAIMKKQENKLMKVDSVSGIKDSNELANLVYKLGQMANYFDRANSSSSRDILSKEDETKKDEFYKLGLQVAQKLKNELSNIKNTGNNPAEFTLFSGESKIVKLLDDVASGMYFMYEPRFKRLSSILEDLYKEYDKYTNKRVRR